MQIISLILSVASAIPVIDKWLGRLLEAYAAYKLEKLKQLNKRAIDEVIKSKDQRTLEDEEHSGKPSGIGTVVSSLPRMRDQSKDKL